MKLFNAAFPFAFALSLLLAAATAHGAEEKFFGVKPKDTGNSMLWEGVSPEGGKVWILGSIHIGKKPWWPFDKAIEEAWGNAKTLAVELNTSDPRIGQAAAAELLLGGLIPEGKPSLSELLGPERSKKLDEALRKDFRCSLSTVNRLRPWKLSVMLELQACAKEGWQAEFGIDKRFMDLAAKESKPIKSLEKLEGQFKMLGATDDEQMAKLVYRMVCEEPSSDEIEMICSCWELGDIEALNSYMQGIGGICPDFVKYAITERNKTMADGVKKLCASKDAAVFVVVGAAHLGGAEGVVALLEKEGFKLKQAPRKGK